MKKSVTLGWVINATGTAPLFTQADVARLVALGVTAVRFEFRLSGHASWDGPIIGLYQEILGLLTNANISVVGLIYNSTLAAHNGQGDWNANATEVGGTDGSNPFQDAYAQACATLASTFPSVVCWEVWNEPNCWTTRGTVGAYTSYAGASYMYPSCYVKLLAAAYAALTAARGGVSVLIGGLLSLTQYGADWGHSGSDYLYALYQAGGWTEGAAPFTGVGWHYYGDQGGQPDLGHIRSYLADLRRTIAWFEDPSVSMARPLYITEVGWQSGKVTPAGQATALNALYADLRAERDVALCSWFCLYDNPALGATFGLYDTAGNQKPSGAALAKVSA